MKRVNVTSKNIRSIGYDSETSTLEVEFLTGGLYQYSDVPDRVHARLMAAGSKGRFFGDHIRDRYPTRKIR